MEEKSGMDFEFTIRHATHILYFRYETAYNFSQIEMIASIVSTCEVSKTLIT